LRPAAVTPGFTRAVCVVQPTAVAVETALAAHPEAVLFPSAADAAPTHFDVFIEQPDANMASWPGKNAERSVFVGRISLAGAVGTCCVVTRQAAIEPGSVTLPRPSPETVDQMRAAIVRGELYGTLVARQNDGTLAMIDMRYDNPERAEADGGAA
jgi:hypothetical protein